MKNDQYILNSVLHRFYNNQTVYPIEAKYLVKCGHYGFPYNFIISKGEHPDYTRKEETDWHNKEVRKYRAYERAHKWLMYSIKNNHLKIEDKPPIAAKPIVEGMLGRPFYPQDVLNLKGVYFLYRNNELLYVGSSKNIYIRIKGHYWGKKIPFNCFKFILFGEEYTMFDVIDFEYCWINDLLPPYNKRLKR